MPFVTFPVGVDLTAIDTTAAFAVGCRARDNAGGEFVYCSFAGTCAAKDVVTIDENFAAATATTSGVAGEDGQPCGVAQAAATAASYVWVRIYGPETGINVATSCAANAPLNTTATAGRIDDDQGTGSYDIIGLTLTAAESSNTAPGVLNYPTISDTTNA